MIAAWAEKLLLVAGICLLGVATFRARVLGHWRALPLLVSLLNNPLISIASFYLGWTQVPWSLFGLFAILHGLSWVLFGGVLWIHKPHEESVVRQAATTS